MSPQTTQLWAAVGDSLTAGLEANQTPWAKLVDTFFTPTKTTRNLGVSGATTAGCSSNYATNVAGQGGSFSGVMFDCGINDILQGGTGADVVTNVTAMVNAARDGGLDALVQTLSPAGNYSGWSAGKQTEWSAANTGLRLLHAPPHVIVIDAAVFMADTDPTKLKASFDNGDGLHWNQAGKNEDAAQVEAVLP